MNFREEQFQEIKPSLLSGATQQGAPRPTDWTTEQNPHLREQLDLSTAAVFLAGHQHQFVQKLSQLLQGVDSRLLAAFGALGEEEA